MMIPDLWDGVLFDPYDGARRSRHDDRPGRPSADLSGDA
jgi:hypothetical protein